MEVAVLAWLVGREVAIILVIVLLAVGGSQLPKLVRTLGESAAAPKGQRDEGTKRDPEPWSSGS